VCQLLAVICLSSTSPQTSASSGAILEREPSCYLAVLDDDNSFKVVDEVRQLFEKKAYVNRRPSKIICGNLVTASDITGTSINSREFSQDFSWHLYNNEIAEVRKIGDYIGFIRTDDSEKEGETEIRMRICSRRAESNTDDKGLLLPSILAKRVVIVNCNRKNNEAIEVNVFKKAGIDPICTIEYQVLESRFIVYVSKSREFCGRNLEEIGNDVISIGEKIGFDR
jgi:hypothetical protein